MLAAYVLNSDATLNNFDVIGSLDFIPGADIELYIRIYQPQRKDKLRYVAPSTAKLTIELPLKDGSDEDIVMTALEGDFSIWHCTISAELTNSLMSGNFTFTLDLLGNGTKLIKGWVQNGLSLVVTGAC